MHVIRDVETLAVKIQIRALYGCCSYKNTVILLPFTSLSLQL